MGKRQKTLSNVSSSKAPVSQRGFYRQSKIVLLPCYTHQSMPSITEEYLSRAKLYQTQTKMSVNPPCKSTALPSSYHKKAPILLPHLDHEALLPHLETQATIMPSPHLKHWDTCCQHEPIPGPDNETKKLFDPEHFEIPKIHQDHSGDASMDVNDKETTSPNPISQPEIALGTSNRDEPISDCAHQYKGERDLDHRTKGMWVSNHQVKSSMDSDDWVQIIQSSEHQTIPSLSLSQKAKDEEVPGHQDQSSLVFNSMEWTIPASDHGTTTLDFDHPPEAQPSAGHQYTFKLSPDSRADNKDLSPTDLEKNSEDIPNPDNQYPLSPRYDHQTPSSNLRGTLNPQYPTEVISPNLYHKSLESQAESSKLFTDSHSIYAPSENGGTISKEFFKNIINSIPREKIKNDIQKQILLRRMRGYHNTQPDSHLSTTYAICLACASWIPYGCPHVNGIKDPYRAQLVVMPSPMPTYKDEMGIKYVLKVPQLKTDTFWNSSQFTSANSSSFPHTVPLKSKIDHQLPKRMTWLNFILAKGDQPHGKKTSGNQQQFKGKMSMNLSTPTEEAGRNEDVVRTLLDKLKNKRNAN